MTTFGPHPQEIAAAAAAPPGSAAEPPPASAGDGPPPPSPRSALRRYALVSALMWLPAGLTLPVMVLLMSGRGLSLAQVGTVTAIHSVVVVVLELPTGGLADVIGRRVVLAASALLSMVALVLMATATTFWPFAGWAVLQGTARALSSGPAQAWYVDTLHRAAGPDADLRHGLSRGEAASSVSLCLATLAGGLIPLVAPGGLAVPVVAGAVAALVLFVVVLAAMPEPPRARPTLRSVLRDVPVTVGSGAGLAVRDPGLRRLVSIAFVLGIGLAVIELLTPGRLAELTGDAESGGLAYAVVAAGGFGAHALGSWVAPWVTRTLGRPSRAAVAGTVVSALALAVLAASAVLGGVAGVVTAGAAYVALFAGMAVAELVRVAMMHERVASSRRATLMSVDSLQLQFGAALSAVGFGALAGAIGSSAVWWLVGGITLLSALLYVRVPAPAPTPSRT
ncbi:MFS transporter [Sphaerisporangium aureirubrum]|uniref:MFS transporter n=1 Tax=Sphaerisporangium aureirubrum TaxID=1544736 RepID=A0ABW1NG90_9ACTN